MVEGKFYAILMRQNGRNGIFPTKLSIFHPGASLKPFYNIDMAKVSVVKWAQNLILVDKRPVSG